MKRKNLVRGKSGASMITLVLVLAFFVILPLGLLGFEISRVFLAQDQIRCAADSAALAGTAAMASAPPGTNATRQTFAMNEAADFFRFNSCLQTNFGPKNVAANNNPSSPTPQQPALHNATLNIVLFDQNNNPVPTGSAGASKVMIQAYYTEAPIFISKLLPIQPTFTVSAVSVGGLPMIDVILCYDCSGSMDDQSNVQLINRYHTALGNQYQPVTKTNDIYDLFLPPPTGTGFNVYPPMNTEYANYGPSATSNTNVYQFSEGVSPNTTYKHLRSDYINFPAGPAGMPEQGMPPGNVKGVAPDPPYPATLFTDCVYDVTGGSGFPATVNGFTFSSWGTVVEAARGNMESPLILQAAGGGSVPPSIKDAPGPGYFNAYWSFVLNNAAPMAQARTAAYNFFNTMNLSANTHFGFETFSDAAGTSPTSTWSGTKENIDGVSPYAPGGTGNFLLPLVAIDQAQSNFSNCVTALEGNNSSTPSQGAVMAYGQTNISAALTEAISELTDNTKFRKTAKKAIVLFTDGVPDQPGGSNAAAAANAIAVAATADKPGIAIYTIGLSTNNAVKGLEDPFLNDGHTVGTSQGIAYQSGQGKTGQYYPVTSVAALNQAFQNIARQLCVIQ